MTPLRILFAGLLAVGTMLYVLNPGPETFEDFFRLDTAERAEAAARAGDSTLAAMPSRVFLADRTGRAVSDAADVGFERTDYHVASLYRVDLNADQRGRASGRSSASPAGSCPSSSQPASEAARSSAAPAHGDDAALPRHARRLNGEQGGRGASLPLPRPVPP